MDKKTEIIQAYGTSLLIGILVGFVLVLVNPFRIGTIEGFAMEPDLPYGTLIVYNKWSRYAEGDIVVVEHAKDDWRCVRLKEYGDEIRVITDDMRYEHTTDKSNLKGKVIYKKGFKLETSS